MATHKSIWSKTVVTQRVFATMLNPVENALAKYANVIVAEKWVQFANNSLAIHTHFDERIKIIFLVRIRSKLKRN